MAFFDKEATGEIFATTARQLDKDLGGDKIALESKKKTYTIARSKYLCDRTLLKYSAFAPPGVNSKNC